MLWASVGEDAEHWPAQGAPFLGIGPAKLPTLAITAEAGSDLTGWTALTALPPVFNSDGTATLRFRDETAWKSILRRFVKLRVTGLQSRCLRAYLLRTS